LVFSWVKKTADGRRQTADDVFISRQERQEKIDCGRRSVVGGLPLADKRRKIEVESS